VHSSWHRALTDENTRIFRRAKILPVIEFNLNPLSYPSTPPAPNPSGPRGIEKWSSLICFMHSIKVSCTYSRGSGLHMPPYWGVLILTTSLICNTNFYNRIKKQRFFYCFKKYQPVSSISYFKFSENCLWSNLFKKKILKLYEVPK
jgi:hypothetical protein